MIHHDSCPLCNGTINREFLCTDYFVSRELFPVDRCMNCGFTFTQDHPSEQETGKYYESEDYISHSDTSKGILNKLFRYSRELMLRKKTALVRKETGISKGSLLDIGTGTGYFANAMKDVGWKVKGIEINEKARLFASTRFGIDIISPDQAGMLEKESFNCITLWHVLEHFSDPFGYMKLIYGLLKPDGICIIALPNCSSYDSLHYKEYWAAWDVPRHLWHFTPETFDRFRDKTGFRLIKTQDLPLDVFYISILSEKYRKSVMPFIKGMVVGAWYWFRSLFRKKRSSSLIYVLGKK